MFLKVFFVSVNNGNTLVGDLSSVYFPALRSLCPIKLLAKRGGTREKI